MPRALKEGVTIHGYRLLKINEPGALASSAMAQAPTGEKVFFKQYKSPSVKSEWYRGYVAYQDELKRRVNGSPLKDFTYKFIDFFTSKDWGPEAYFQVFEFVSGGQDLADYLASDPSWEKRVVFARTLMHVMKLLHEAKIIHCDLKPENLFLMPAPTRHGYTLKVIDMDFSILSDKKAPWDGYEGYVGTPKYFSPEHLAPKGVPLTASDVFTCGLILYELLAQGGHPYDIDDEKRYKEAALGHAAPVPELRGGFAAADAAGNVAKTLWQMLSPDPRQRPTAAAVHQALLQAGPVAGASSSSSSSSSIPRPAPAPRPAAPVPAAPTPAPAPRPAPAPATPPRVEPAAAPSCVITSPRTGKSIKAFSGNTIGRAALNRLDEDFGQFYSSSQFTLIFRDGAWFLRHSPGATNVTDVDDAPVSGEAPLHDGAVIAVGKTKKMPVTVNF